MDIGHKIKELRKTKGLTLEELASRSELSKGFLSQVERSLTSPSISTLEDILEALGSDLSTFFQEPKTDQIVFGAEDFFVDEKEEYTLDWIVPNAQKNEMEPVLVTISPQGRSMEVANHDGEEFGYVLKGSIIIEFEDAVRMKVRAKECFYMNGNRAHTLFNPGNKEAVVIWVCTPPIF